MLVHFWIRLDILQPGPGGSAGGPMVEPSATVLGLGLTKTN